MSSSSGTAKTSRPFKWSSISCYLMIVIPSMAMLLLGIYSRRDGGLGPNPCQMTYTSRDMKEINVVSAIAGPKMYKFTNYNNRKLNRQPVLFIPGHKGM